MSHWIIFPLLLPLAAGMFNLLLVRSGVARNVSCPCSRPLACLSSPCSSWPAPLPGTSTSTSSATGLRRLASCWCWTGFPLSC